MPLLGRYTYTGLVSMANASPADGTGVFCLAHGITGTPDVALATCCGPSASGAGIVSVPIGLISRTAATAIFNTGAGSVGLSAEVFVQYVHSILR